MKFAKPVLFCVMALLAACPAGAVSVAILDPYLVRPDQLGDLQLQSFLAGNPNLANYQASALAEDGVAAGIILVATDSNSPVMLSVQNVGGFEPYSDDFLQHAPPAPAASLTVSDLWNINGIYYAAALFQAPAEAPPSQGMSYTAAISASQGGNQQNASINLILPPVVLVHGLWGDATSLSDMESYLDSAGHWSRQYVAPICYSKYLAFDATTDPLSDGKHPCEVTSQAALETEINSMLATLDAGHIAAGRIDTVAHSMGGLVLRNYASLSGYASYRNRTLGQLHTITTLNTPETGSLLANFLITHRNSTRKASAFTTPGAVWLAACGFSDVKGCFADLGYPLYGPGLPVKTGVVYALEPGSPNLNNPNLSGPNIAGVQWLAISSKAPGNSALAAGVNTLIAALYANPYGKGVPNVNSILGNVPNDAIVALDSQTNGAPQGHVVTFPKLSHTYLVSSLLTLLSGGSLNDNSVLQDRGVEKTASCWLAIAGAGTCFTPGGREEAPALQALPAVNVVDGIRLSAPRRAELGKPFEIAVHSLIKGKTPQLTIFQQSDQGSTPPAIAKRVRVEGDTAFVEITPVLPGLTVFGIKARFGDSVAMQKVELPVALPKTPPLEFKANAQPRLVLVLNDATRVATPRPLATYAAPVGQVALNSDAVRYRVLPGSGAPIVRPTPDGRLVGLRAGHAAIEGQFGSAPSRFQVIVRAANQ